MINHLTEVQLQPLLFILVTPLFRILEDSSRTDDQMGTFWPMQNL